MMGCTLHAKEVRNASGGQYQIVVLQERLIRLDDSGVEIDAMDVGHSEVDERMPPKETSDGIGDLARPQLGRGYLVQEREEGVVVVPVDQRGSEPMRDEPAHGPQPAEPRPDHYDPRMGQYFGRLGSISSTHA